MTFDTSTLPHIWFLKGPPFACSSRVGSRVNDKFLTDSTMRCRRSQARQSSQYI